MNEATQTPMADRIQHFWNAISEPHVRILVDMRRDHDDGSFHWDSSSFGDDVAKALVGSRTGAPQGMQPDWQPIRTAPKDGRDIEVRYLTDDPRLVRWSQSHHGTTWHLSKGIGPVIIEFEPTEWRDVVPRSAATSANPVVADHATTETSHSEIPNHSNCSKSSNGSSELLPRRVMAEGIGQRLDASPEPDAVRKPLSQQAIMDILQQAGLKTKPMITTRWKDGIDIDEPSYLTMTLVDALQAALSAPVAGAWQDIAHEARFLLDRLEELDDANDDEYVREFEGHVRPPMSRLRRLLPRNDRGSPCNRDNLACDRAEITIQRAVNCGWVTVHDREQLKATIRIALDTEVRAGGPSIDDSANEIERLRSALTKIEKWFGEFPSTGRFWDHEQAEEMSYAACFGSNGERDFMRSIARDALTSRGSDHATSQTVGLSHEL